MDNTLHNNHKFNLHFAFLYVLHVVVMYLKCMAILHDEIWDEILPGRRAIKYYREFP